MRKILKRIVKKIGRKKYIIFESVPDVGDNSKAVFDEMIRRGLNRKYKLVWLLGGEKKDFPRYHNVIYAEKSDKKRKWYMTKAKCFICCNAFVYSDDKEQKSFFLTHGMYVKRPTSYYSLPNQIQYCFSSSEQMKEVQAKALGVHDNCKMVPLGFPRNDILTSARNDLHAFFKQDYDKLIVWYPTFRQHKSGMGTGSIHPIPLIWNEASAQRINEYAKKNRVLIVLKPHFAQDVSHIKELGLSNICFIDDSFFTKCGFSSYEFLRDCDAMLTDYSSVYFDYTLCDKPIGLIWEDYKEYEKQPGFALDMDYYMQGGARIYTDEDLQRFILDVANGVDSLVDRRRKVRDISNYSTDGKSSERVVDFIIHEAGL